MACRFTNPWGQDDPDQRVTARDMANLAADVIKTYPQYYHYFGEKDFTWNKIKQPNRNPLLTMDVGADGLKTGNIDASGYGIVASAVQNGQRLILAIYGAKSAKERETEAVRLLQWGFRSFAAKTLFQPGEVVGYAQVYGGSSGSEPLVSDTPVRVLVPRDSDEKLKGQIVYMGPLLAPVSAGQEVAHLRLFRGAAADSGGSVADLDCDRHWHIAATGHGCQPGICGGPVPQICIEEMSLSPRLPKRGTFITLEGGEGVGKSTQVRYLIARLEARGIAAISTREPGGSPGAEILRDILLSGMIKDLGPKAEAILFAAARLDHIDHTIGPALAAGTWVICDRFAEFDARLSGRARRPRPRFPAPARRIDGCRYAA